MPDESQEIYKKIVLKAPLDKVWAAISDAGQFRQWFGVRFDGPFRAGEKLTGEIVPRTRFSFRWHPYGMETGCDYSREPMTLCTFALSEDSEGVQLVITESGFEHIPLERRASAFAANDGGWSVQNEAHRGVSCRLRPRFLPI